MRIIALLNEDRYGALTNANATVGEISLNGTLGLLALGSIAGVLGGLLYLVLRRWLLVPRAWRGVAFGALTLLTVGQPLFDPHNVDFQIFEPILVVIGLFAGLFFINGLILARLLDRIHREPVYSPGTRVPRVVVAAIGLVAALGLLVMAGTVQTMIDDEGTCYAAVGGGEGCAVFEPQ